MVRKGLLLHYCPPLPPSLLQQHCSLLCEDFYMPCSVYLSAVTAAATTTTIPTHATLLLPPLPPPPPYVNACGLLLPQLPSPPRYRCMQTTAAAATTSTMTTMTILTQLKYLSLLSTLPDSLGCMLAMFLASSVPSDSIPNAIHLHVCVGTGYSR